jgi:glycosyltransferase involved in cell wall biosynthesis
MAAAKRRPEEVKPCRLPTDLWAGRARAGRGAGPRRGGPGKRWKKIMRILGLYQRPEHVCFRYRLEAYRPYLEAQGHEVRFRGWPRWWLFESRFFQELRGADLVVVQRRLLSRWQLERVRRAASALAFDFDDAVYLRDSFDPRGPGSDRRRRGFARMVRAADVVVAGNACLRDHALEWTGPERVRLVPTCIDLERYPRAAHSPGKPATHLVWIGSSSTLRGLERIKNWLDWAGQTLTGLNLKLICDRSLELAHLPIRFCPWAQATEARELAGADIGISWLPFDAWSEGKCGLKILQYMAAGLPVVANPVGVQARLVRHGETGFLAETANDWQAAIRTLAADPGLRRRMGARGRQLVAKEFHVTQGAAAWLELLKTFRHSQVAALPRA